MHVPLKIKKPKKTSEVDWEFLDRQTFRAICLTLAPNVAFGIVNEKLPKN